MTRDERRLFAGLLGMAAERFSQTGHVLQQVHEENRGHCPWYGCNERCQVYAALVIEASELLEAEMREPEQIGLFGSEAAG